MAKANNATAFEEILSTFGSDEDRSAFQGLSERNPKLKEYGLRQDEFSRKLNEVGDKLSSLDRWETWRRDHWIEDKQKTDFELAAEARANALVEEQATWAAEKAELETRLAGGEVASFEEVQQWIGKAMTDKGVVTKDTLEAKEKQFEGALAGSQAALGRVALDVPYLNSLHEKEFGELFRPRDFLEAANKNGAVDLEEFYARNYVVEKRQAKMKSDFESQLAQANADKEAAVAAAKEQGRLEREREAAMGTNGQQPVDLEGSEMGAFQRQYLKVPDDGSGKAPDVPLGDGGVAHYAARQFIQSQSNRHS